MSVITIQKVDVGCVGVAPAEYRILTDDTFATVSSIGYLTQFQPQYNFATTDFAQVYTTDMGTIEFSITVSDGEVSLSYNQDSALVTLPTVLNHFSVFSNTEGHMKDSGLIASASSQSYVVTSPGALTSGNLSIVTDVNGTLGTSSIAPSNVVIKNGSNVMGAGSSIVTAKVTATEASNAVTASAMSGVITTSSLTTAAGSSYVITWTNSFIASTSVILLSVQGGTNTRQAFRMSVVPGSGSATLTIYNNEPTNALNGTIIIGFTVL